MHCNSLSPRMNRIAPQGGINQLVTACNAALESDNGKEFADIMSINHQSVKKVWKVDYVNVEPPFDQLMYEHIQCTNGILNNDYLSAFQHQCNVVQAFSKLFTTQKEDNWGLPMMSTIIKDLYFIAIRADLVAVSKGDSAGARLDTCADMLMSVFRVCASDSRTSIEYSKRWGMMTIINLLFKCYFKTNKLHLCKPLIRAIESSNIKEEYSISDRVTFNFFVGMKYMFDDDFKGANKCLTFAFENCHRDSQKNKRKILTYLIPVKITLGLLPKQELLTKYKLHQFSAIVDSVRKGDIKTLNDSLEKHAAFFIKAGIYLILQKLKIITTRNLFKKIYLITGTHQMDIASFQCALNWLGMDDVDADETECILANMINDGYIKGYISEQHKKIVVSKKLAFPQLNTFL